MTLIVVNFNDRKFRCNQSLHQTNAAAGAAAFAAELISLGSKEKFVECRLFYFFKIYLLLILVPISSFANSTEGNKIKAMIGAETGIGDFRNEAESGIAMGLTYTHCLRGNLSIGLDGHYAQFGSGVSSGHSVRVSILSLGVLGGYGFNLRNKNHAFLALGPALFFANRHLGMESASQTGIAKDTQTQKGGLIGIFGMEHELKNNWVGGVECRLSHYGSNSTTGLFITFSKWLD